MAVYTYTALGSDGSSTAGTIPAPTRAAAIAEISSRGLHPVQIAEQVQGEQKTSGVRLPVFGGNRITQAHVESFTRELATLLGGGVPLSRALHLLCRESSAPGPRKLWEEIHDEVVGGTALADTLAQHPEVFSSIYVAMVRAGRGRWLPRCGARADRRLPYAGT